MHINIKYLCEEPKVHDPPASGQRCRYIARTKACLDISLTPISMPDSVYYVMGTYRKYLACTICPHNQFSTMNLLVAWKNRHKDKGLSSWAALLNGLKICKISIFRRCSWDVKLSIGWSGNIQLPEDESSGSCILPGLPSKYFRPHLGNAVVCPTSHGYGS